jgi:hypothetical protein
MTESCHFDDKDSLGGSFCVWRGGSIMATTRIMPLHVGKGRTESWTTSDIIDYVVNPQKTDEYSGQQVYTVRLLGNRLEIM